MAKIHELLSHSSRSAERIPEIPLYMDQVLSYLDASLENLKRSENEPCITKTMINNYVKAGLLQAPVKKKYTRSHMMALTMLYRLKSVLQVKDIEAVLGEQKEEGLEMLYEEFLMIEKEIGRNLSEKYENFDFEDEDSIHKAILQLAVEADMNKRLMEHLIDKL
ncbi:MULTISPECIES: DUF1836 domain-containing protein [unclassified Fusibacter]|uniref:DUF1836 domain-containing protein n=1 Tax=unclassified Fusibacter TaxID=2624464 RepID=UPI001012D826|nr:MULTISPECIES: DUF1836 domain-containing protein [unclassified Fusibacter]MCK8061226.1 DUF1836 domain-containing protein [Fusibacter sp. A2]NPE23430.1 DUF1836 domain-containing protein [Fusibacter sp. A1]RXV59209.1 DUF1836 domain-containing protein [Fusibacter sp. A1]